MPVVRAGRLRRRAGKRCPGTTGGGEHVRRTALAVGAIPGLTQHREMWAARARWLLGVALTSPVRRSGVRSRCAARGTEAAPAGQSELPLGRCRTRESAPQPEDTINKRKALVAPGDLSSRIRVAVLPFSPATCRGVAHPAWNAGPDSRRSERRQVLLGSQRIAGVAVAVGLVQRPPQAVEVCARKEARHAWEGWQSLATLQPQEGTWLGDIVSQAEPAGPGSAISVRRPQLRPPALGLRLP